MTLRVRAPRLLPVTIAVLAVALVFKSTVLVRSAIHSPGPAALIAAAWAAGPEPPPAAAKSAPRPAEAPMPPVPGGGIAGAAVTEGPPPVSDAERAVLLELRDRRRELDVREAAMASRELMLSAAETKLSARVEELQTLQKKLESLDATHKQQEDAAWQGLVKVYETMKPRDAAVIFNDLGMPVLLAVVDRMKEAKAAAILAAMTPEKARDLTMQLALSRTRGADSGDKPSPDRTPAGPPGSGT